MVALTYPTLPLMHTHATLDAPQVGASSWSDGAELGETWVARNAFSYGRGAERGAARPEVLRALLSTTERVVQQVDSVEYGLTDIQVRCVFGKGVFCVWQGAQVGAHKHLVYV